MKKIVQINVSNYGSTGSIMKTINELGIKNGFEMHAFYGRGKKSEIEGIDKFGNTIDIMIHILISRLFDMEGKGSYFSTRRLIKKIKKINPDIIHLHNIHGYYINNKLLFKYLKESDVKVIWTLHDCWAFTGHCSYFDKVNCNLWQKECHKCLQKREYPKSILIDRSKKNFYRKKKIFNSLKKENLTIVTPSIWLKKLVEQSFLSQYKVKVINNDVDTDVFKPTISDFRKNNNLEDKKIILGIANVWDERKGLNMYKKLADILDEKYQIILVGLNENQIRELPRNIIGIGRTKNQKELVELYTVADVFFNPTLEDNYPTVNLEAQLCGTPVLTYNTGGCKETIFTPYSVVLKKNEQNEKNIKDAIEKICNKNIEDIEIECTFNNFNKYIDFYKHQSVKKKLLFVSNTPAPYRIEFFKELSKYVDLTVAFEKRKSSERHESWNRFNYNNYKTLFLSGIKVSTDKAISPSIIKVLKKNKDKKIIIGNPLTPTGIIGIIYMKIKKYPYAIEIDGGFSKKIKFIKRIWKTLIIKGAEEYYSTSEEGDKYLLDYGAKKDKIIRYPFTSIKETDILTDKLSETEKERIKMELGITEKKVVLSVGRFIYSKGYDVLIKASKDLGEDVGVYIVGGKPTQEYLRLKEDYSVKNVHFVDFKLKDELKKYYMCADIFVLPTRSDVWGLVINEAMACGLPVVTTDKCIAGLELIENGINGYVVRTDGVNELKDAIKKIINDENLLEDMRKNNLGKIRTYTIENMALSHIERI